MLHFKKMQLKKRTNKGRKKKKIKRKNFPHIKNYIYPFKKIIFIMRYISRIITKIFFVFFFICNNTKIFVRILILFLAGICSIFMTSLGTSFSYFWIYIIDIDNTFECCRFRQFKLRNYLI